MDNKARSTASAIGEGRMKESFMPSKRRKKNKYARDTVKSPNYRARQIGKTAKESPNYRARQLGKMAKKSVATNKKKNSWLQSMVKNFKEGIKPGAIKDLRGPGKSRRAGSLLAQRLKERKERDIPPAILEQMKARELKKRKERNNSTSTSKTEKYYNKV